ncbi:hypothetical protein COO91_04490 [Nostoc flagelliforme CCNUN1]|uniref:Uncharacterized protein n=1 Tax=Nostoc flagelliforme CCNUN1 TaxID=2038116 RepID=A0A2K8ST46_9NOSO|nr:hypothetical protein COO91_04490 [Nostoc flagelliforme CCNUN1]
MCDGSGEKSIQNSKFKIKELLPYAQCPMPLKSSEFLFSEY